MNRPLINSKVLIEDQEAEYFKVSNDFSNKAKDFTFGKRSRNSGTSSVLK